MIEMDECDKGILNTGAQYMLDYKGEKNLIIDMGAHVGCSATFYAAELGFKRVFAVEACWENFRLLVNNIYNNHLETAITPMWGAVAGLTGEWRPIYLSGSQLNHGQHGTFFRPDKHIKVGYTQTISFEHILSLFDKIDVLKIDIEGGEYEIFSPLNCRIKEALKKVVFLDLETHCPENTFFLSGQFKTFGYPDSYSANDILKSYLAGCGFDFNFRGGGGGMQGYNKYANA